MKLIKLHLLVAAMIIVTSGCVGSGKKYKQQENSMDAVAALERGVVASLVGHVLSFVGSGLFSQASMLRQKPRPRRRLARC